MIFIQLIPLIPFDFVHVKNLFWINQPYFINVLLCFNWFSLIRARNWALLIFLDSLFFRKSTIKILEFFLTGWTGWEPVQQVVHVQPCFINALPCFDQSSLIWAQNWVSLLFMAFLFFGESIVKISGFFSTGWTGWEPVQQVLYVQPYFINALPYFDWFSLIRAWNWASLLLLDSILFGEPVKILEFLSIIWISWKPIQ